MQRAPTRWPCATFPHGDVTSTQAFYPEPIPSFHVGGTNDTSACHVPMFHQPGLDSISNRQSLNTATCFLPTPIYQPKDQFQQPRYRTNSWPTCSNAQLATLSQPDDRLPIFTERVLGTPQIATTSEYGASNMAAMGEQSHIETTTTDMFESSDIWTRCFVLCAISALGGKVISIHICCRRGARF